jgi:hypothetical protein
MNNPFVSPSSARSPIYAGIASDAVPVIPSDSVDLPQAASGLYIEAAGAVAFITASGVARTVNVPAFFVLPCGVSRVLASGTTATGIHALVI